MSHSSLVYCDVSLWMLLFCLLNAAMFFFSSLVVFLIWFEIELFRTILSFDFSEKNVPVFMKSVPDFVKLLIPLFRYFLKSFYQYITSFASIFSDFIFHVTLYSSTSKACFISCGFSSFNVLLFTLIKSVRNHLEIVKLLYYLPFREVCEKENLIEVEQVFK